MGQQQTVACRCFPRPLPLFLILFGLPFIWLGIKEQPDAEEWAKVWRFLTVEIHRNLYLQFLWTVPLFYYLARLDKLFWVIFALFGGYHLVQFVAYYFVPGDIIRATELPLPVCNSPSGECSVWEDLQEIVEEPDQGAQIWVDDAMWCIIVSVPFILIESIRYRFVVPGLFYALATIILGFDISLPFFFIHLTYLEKRYQPRSIGRYHWLYWLLALLAVVSWIPHLYTWIIRVGTVAGQLSAGTRLVVGSRATWAVMGASFTVGFYTVPYIELARPKGFAGGMLAWVVRVLMVNAIESNVAGALAAFLYFREFTPNASFMSGGKAQPSGPKGKQRPKAQSTHKKQAKSASKKATSASKKAASVTKKVAGAIRKSAQRQQPKQKSVKKSASQTKKKSK